MVGLNLTQRAAIVAAAFASAGFAATAQELIYKPVNPSFGGDSFNSAHLLGIANAQNDYKDPNSPTTGNSQIDQFLRQLQSRLLSSLAAQVNDAIFGDNPQQSGTITFGDQVITFVRLLDSVQLTITDNTTGAVTEISIPLLGQTTSGTTGNILGLLSSGDLSSESPSDPLSGLGSITGEGDLTPGGF
ncbi:MAG TPA: curli assembly protein CsgF [Hyphomonas sp.]|nr:curli assembly protein CsgG [Hyphomonas sp.]HRI99604.1 curli assembly protein CsgF [Hyphomonas sp.]HRK66947.1 curli assembly protein CsgF [Hyphomonas sp.]